MKCRKNRPLTVELKQIFKTRPNSVGFFLLRTKIFGVKLAFIESYLYIQVQTVHKMKLHKILGLLFNISISSVCDYL